jgi:hypothetical protein
LGEVLHFPGGSIDAGDGITFPARADHLTSLHSA